MHKYTLIPTTICNGKFYKIEDESVEWYSEDDDEAYEKAENFRVARCLEGYQLRNDKGTIIADV